MDRHICGSCHAEINDLDEFIVHKRKTCPELLRKNPETSQISLKRQKAQISSGLVDVPWAYESEHETSGGINVKEANRFEEKEKEESCSNNIDINDRYILEDETPTKPDHVSPNGTVAKLNNVSQNDTPAQSDVVSLNDTPAQSDVVSLNDTPDSTGQYQSLSESNTVLDNGDTQSKILISQGLGKENELTEDLLRDKSNTSTLNKSNETDQGLHRNLQEFNYSEVNVKCNDSVTNQKETSSKNISISDIDHQEQSSIECSFHNHSTAICSLSNSTLTDSIACTPPVGHEYIQTAVRSSIPRIELNSKDTLEHGIINQASSDNTAENAHRDELSARSLQMVLDHNGSYSLLSKVPKSLQTDNGNVQVPNQSLQTLLNLSSPQTGVLNQVLNDPPQMKVLPLIPNNDSGQEILPQNQMVLLKHKESEKVTGKQFDKQLHASQIDSLSFSDSHPVNTSVSLSDSHPLYTSVSSSDSHSVNTSVSLSDSYPVNTSVRLTNNSGNPPIEIQKTKHNATSNLRREENLMADLHQLLQNEEISLKCLNINLGKASNRHSAVITEDSHRGKLKHYTSKTSHSVCSTALSLLKTNDIKRLTEEHSNKGRSGANISNNETDAMVQNGKGQDFIVTPTNVEFNENVNLGVLSSTLHSVVQTVNDPIYSIHQGTISNSLLYTTTQSSHDTSSDLAVLPTSSVTCRWMEDGKSKGNQSNTTGLLSTEPCRQAAGVLEQHVGHQQQGTKKGQKDEGHSSSGIQYVLHKTPERNYFLPIHNGTSEDDITPPRDQPLVEQTSPEKVISRADSPRIEYTLQLQSIDNRSVLDGQIIQVINTPEKYPSTLGKKKSSNTVNTVHSKKGSSTASKEREKKFACSYDNCSYSTIYYKDLKRHQRTHTGEKPYKCGMCDKSFSRLDKLRLHIRAHTGEKPYQCNVCDYRAVDSSALKKHEIIHTDERPYTCQLCSYTCRTSSQLTVHLRTHTGDCPFTCPKCKRKFKIKSDLKRHYLTHTGEKPWHCTECEMRFTTQGNLVQHKKIHHSPDKQSKCSHCDFKTSSKRAMLEHVKSHEPENPDTTCQICDLRCASHEILRRHMIVHRYDYIRCSHCEFVTRHQYSLEEHIKRKHSEHYHENNKNNLKQGKTSSKRESSSHTNDLLSRESESRKDTKSRKSSYRKFQRTHRCDKCDESFVRKDSLNSHRRLHEELDRDLHHLSSAGAVFMLKNPTTSSEVTDSGQQYSSVLNRLDDPLVMQSSHYKEPSTQEYIRNRGMSDTYYRNESVQTSDVSGNHRRQLDFDADFIRGGSNLLSTNHQFKTASSSRLSLDISQSSHISLESSTSNRRNEHRRRHTVHNDSDHTFSKRNKTSSDTKTYSKRPVRELLKAERQEKRSAVRDKRQENIEKHVRGSISDKHSYPSSNNLDSSHHKSTHDKSLGTHSRSYTMDPNEPTENNVSFQSLERCHLPLIEAVNSPRTVPLPQHQQSVYQLPNLQLVQNISLPLVRLPDGQIVGTQVGNQLAGTQFIREVNQSSFPNAEIVHQVNENVQTLQFRTPPNVELLSPQNSSSQILHDVSIPQVVKIVDQIGNSIPTQFVLPTSCPEDVQCATIQTIDLSAVQEQGSVDQSIMMSPTHVVTVPIQVLDIPNTE